MNIDDKMTLPDDPKEALRRIAGYLRTLDMTNGRVVYELSAEPEDGTTYSLVKHKRADEVVGYWQCTEWLDGLKDIADECDRIGALMVVAPVAEPEQPTMNCPRCKKEYEDFDGVGVVYCGPAIGGCGFCRHVARSGGVCDLCGGKESALPPWRVELERLRKLRKDFDQLHRSGWSMGTEAEIGTVRDVLPKLEELETLRLVIESGNGTAGVPREVAMDLSEYCGPCAYDCMELPTKVINAEWECQRRSHRYAIRKPNWLTSIDSAGAAVLAGEG